MRVRQSVKCSFQENPNNIEAAVAAVNPGMRLQPLQANSWVKSTLTSLKNQENTVAMAVNKCACAPINSKVAIKLDIKVMFITLVSVARLVNQWVFLSATETSSLILPSWKSFSIYNRRKK